jgi:hypothetical protein
MSRALLTTSVLCSICSPLESLAFFIMEKIALLGSSRCAEGRGASAAAREWGRARGREGERADRFLVVIVIPAHLFCNEYQAVSLSNVLLGDLFGQVDAGHL